MKNLSIIVLLSALFFSCSNNNKNNEQAESDKQEAENRNIELKKDIKNFSSVATLESIARNNLKMAKKDEVLIIVNTKKEPTKKKRHLLGNKKITVSNETNDD